MFAGPNCSGKSTIKAQVDERLWGPFINADDIEANVKKTASFDFGSWGIATHAEEIQDFFAASWVKAKRPQWESEVKSMLFEGASVYVGDVPVNSYLATVIADFLREKLLEKRVSFTFETVMSDKSKVRLLEKARGVGYRTYLYYVATRDVEINVARCITRVKQGGHFVPENKIRERYTRSLDLLVDAIRASDRAYLWDNSDVAVLFAEFENGCMIPRTPEVPAWFKTFVLDKA